MPFTSKAQQKKCFAMKGRGQAKGWDCEEWAHATPNLKKLPEHVDGEKKGAAELLYRRVAVCQGLEKQAQTLPQLLGIRAAAVVLGVFRPQ
jgi:hypothetical protein